MPGHVGAIFRFWALPQRFLDVVINFLDFSSILNGFWEDLGRVLEDLGRVLIGCFNYFFVFLSKITIL